MYFDFNDEQKMVAESVRKVVNKYYPVSEVKKFIEEQNISRPFVREFADLGMIGIMAKEEAGGLGLGAVDTLSVFMEAGHSVVPFPLLENILGSKLLSEFQPEKAEPIITGEQLVTMVWEGEGQGFYRNNEGRVHGVFKFVPFAKDSDWLIAPVKLTGSGNTPKEDLAIVLIDLSSSNVCMEKMDSMDLTYPLYTVYVESYPITSSDVLGGLRNGDHILSNIKQLGSLFLCAEMFGASEIALQKSVRYTKERVQFGQPVAKFQALKHMAAENYLICEGQRNAVEYAAWAYDQKEEEKDLAIAIANSYISEQALIVAQNAIQMHGGIGFTWEHDMHLYLKRVIRSSSTLGDAYDHREKVAAMVLD